MTIIEEEKFSFKNGALPPFIHFRSEVEDAFVQQSRLYLIDGEKMRLLKSGVTYDEFKDLVSTVHLKPVSRKKGGIKGRN